MKLYTYRIGEIFTRFSSGKNITENKISDTEQYPVYGGNGLRGYTDVSNFSGECVIVGRQGAKCGNVRYFKGTGYMTDHAIVGVAKPEFSIRYISYALDSLNLNRLSGQAAQPGLSVTMLKKQKILIPSYKDQCNIAEIISSYDELIENNERQINLLEQVVEELYKEWFVRFRFPGFETIDFKEATPSGWIVESNSKNLIPKDWHYGELREIAEFKRGKNITSTEMIEGGIPVISAGIEPSGYHNVPNVYGSSLTMSASV